MDTPCKKRQRGTIRLTKIKKIINREFQKEFDLREKQLELIQQRINQAQKTLHILRYVLVNNYYNSANASNVTQFNQSSISSETTPQRLHPAVKKLLTSFSADSTLHTDIKLKPRRYRQEKKETSSRIDVPSTSAIEPCISNDVNNRLGIATSNFGEIKQEPLETSTVAITPSTSPSTSLPHSYLGNVEGSKVVRNRNKKEYVIVVGNISKWMPAESEEDKSTHKWMVYVRGPKSNPSIAHFVQRVVFYLHPSYKPNDVVEIKAQPFHLSRRGWGEFPLRVRIYFVHSLNKPVDVVHQLKLDKTFTGRQTLGNETVVNLQLYTNEKTVKAETIIKEEFATDLAVANDSINYSEHDYCHEEIKQEWFETNSIKEIKQEWFEEEKTNSINLDHSYCSKTATAPSVQDIEQPENALIYGLDYDNSNSTKSVVEEIIVEHNMPKVPVVNNVISTQYKRKSQQPLIKQMFNKKQRLHDMRDSSKYQIEIPKRRFKNVLQALPFLFKHLPIITKLACDNTYKCTYPYVAASLQEYSKWNIGRRLSSEWFQAKTILNIVKTNQIPDCMSWTTKKMIMYARAHGYTPLANYAIFKRNSIDYLYNYIPNGGWVEELKPIVPSEEIIEVTDCKTAPEKPEKYSKITQLIDLNLQKASSFIRHSALDVGVILKPEEIVPGVLFNAAERVLLQAVLCLAEDLIRKARAVLVQEGNFKEESSIITTDYICKVLTSRSEFNLLLQSDTD